jgi:glycosyltransferase involved in cell wall biosynthesis
MKILHVTQGYWPAIGGTEFLVQRISEELVQQFGDEVTVFTTNCYNGEAFFTPSLPRLPAGEEEINGVRIRRFPVNSRVSQMVRLPQSIAYKLRLPGNQYLRMLGSGPVIPGLEEAIHAHPFDVAAASSFPLMHMFTTLRAAQATNRPCVLYGGIHPQDEWGFHRPMIYEAIRQADHYIAYTGFEADYVTRRGANPQQVTDIGVGVDVEEFSRIDPSDARRRLGLEAGPVVAFIGQLGGFKGVNTLVKAMPAVWEQFPDAHLLIAGGRTLYAQTLETMIAALPEAQRRKVTLRYNFPNEDKPLFFAAADAFAYPSGYESFGIAYLEAWASYKPVIGCWRGAIPWVVHAGRDGLLVPFGDDAALAEAIKLLFANPRWARQLGEAGHQKVIERYNWPAIARRFRQVYESVQTQQR